MPDMTRTGYLMYDASPSTDARHPSVSGKYVKGTRRLTLFTKSNLAELAGPVLPNPISNTRSHNDRDCNSKEYAPVRRSMLLIELIILSGARISSGALVEFGAPLTTCTTDPSVTCGLEVLNRILILFAKQRVVWRWKALHKIT
jgi:hypothetical protein